MIERRKAPRRRILKSGKIRHGKAGISCTVRNLSEIGASLVVQTTFGIPKTFEFAMPGRPPRKCKVIWRNETTLGVEFQDAE